jgi:GNAT superfamily N-acetyltransferase
MQHLRFQAIENGAVALRGAEEVARLTGKLDENVFGRHAWISYTIADGEDRAVLADLYALAADPWVRDGRLPHYVEVPADDEAALAAWSALSFGRQQVHASRSTADPVVYDGPVRVRRGGPDDIESALSMAYLITEQHLLAPVWAGVIPDPETTRADYAEFLADPETGYFFAELDGRPIGHAGLYLLGDDITHLAVAATLPAARRRGAMRALISTALAWAAERGFTTCTTDWRSTNLVGARTWTGFGWHPTRYRLHRLVGH